MTMIVLHAFTAFPVVDGQPDYDTPVIIERDEVVEEIGSWLHGGRLFSIGDGDQYVTDNETFDWGVVP